jgi:hypothetical protein
LLTNAQKHYGVEGPDELASRVALVVPRTWLLRRVE